MEEKFRAREDLFDSIIDEIEHPERKGSFKNPFADDKMGSGGGINGAVSVISVKIAEDKMAASVIVNSHTEKHRPYTIKDIFDAIKEAGVIYGVSTPAVMNMVNKQLFNRYTVIAYGTYAEKGNDGHLMPCFRKNEDGKAIVSAGDIICRIVEPTKGKFGMNVCGETIESTMGRPVSLKCGDNIAVSRDCLIATASGTLSEINGIYSVVNEQIIEGNITAASGPINYSGALIIKGNVSERAYVKAGNSIHICGKANGVIIEAEGNVTIDGEAMDCVITSKNGSIICKGFTACVLNAGDSITAEFIIRSKTKAVMEIKCIEGQGTISGGTIECMGEVYCNMAGNRHRDKTLFKLGDSAECLENKHSLEAALIKIEQEIEKIDWRLEGLAVGDNASIESKNFAEAALRIRERKESEKEPILARLADVEEALRLTGSAALHVRSTVFVGVIIDIGEFRQVIDHDRNKTYIHANNNGIVMT